MTVPEVRRLLTRLVWTVNRPADSVLGLIPVETAASGQGPTLPLQTSDIATGISSAAVVLIRSEGEMRRSMASVER